MYKLYTIAKKKTGILGLWKDKEKIYRDKIKIKNCSTYRKLQLNIKKLFDNGEKAVFYNSHFYCTIESKEGIKTLLSKRITWQEKKLKASFIKLLLSQHGGLTIFKEKQGFTFDIWKE